MGSILTPRPFLTDQLMNHMSCCSPRTNTRWSECKLMFILNMSFQADRGEGERRSNIWNPIRFSRSLGCWRYYEIIGYTIQCNIFWKCGRVLSIKKSTSKNLGFASKPLYQSIVLQSTPSARKVILPQHVADDFAAKCLDSSPAGYYLSSSLSFGSSPRKFPLRGDFVFCGFYIRMIFHAKKTA